MINGITWQVLFWMRDTTLCLKKVPTFKLSVTLSNLNRFGKVLQYWKACENCYKTHTTLPTSPYACYCTTLGYQKFKFSANIQQIWKNAKMHFQCTDFNSSTHVTVYTERIYVFWSKSCPRCWMPCWLLTNTAAASAVTNFRCHRLIAKVNK